MLLGHWMSAGLLDKLRTVRYIQGLHVRLSITNLLHVCYIEVISTELSTTAASAGILGTLT